MSTKGKVIVAMSGGVDSSVAAALLVEQGYEVVGLMLRLWAEEGGGAANRCCTPSAVLDAARVADLLGIPFYVRNYQDIFKRTVVDFFVAEYLQGRTPNPCALCNREIRFGRLLQEALSLGGDYLATGHYARIRRSETGEYHLLRGLDPAKDQSYILYTLTQERLAHILFPVGDYTKAEIRALAQTQKLPVFDRPDSQDLCFLGAGDYRDFLRRHAGGAIHPGPILDTTGKLLGEHQGLPCYTIGQRKGLGLAAGQAYYVLRLDPATNTLIVGPKAELERRALTARQVTYISGSPPPPTTPVVVKIRYKAAEVAAILTPLPGDRAHVAFAAPVQGVTPGQVAVFFESRFTESRSTGERLLGGGIIEAETTAQTRET
jgi:tRNA-specific 2-thiouridylase